MVHQKVYRNGMPFFGSDYGARGAVLSTLLYSEAILDFGSIKDCIEMEIVGSFKQFLNG